MKGAELPINTLIVLVLAVIVLIAIIAILYVVYNPSKQSVGKESAKDNACNALVSMNCAVGTETIYISNFDANQNDKTGVEELNTGWTWGTSCGAASSGGDNLASLCQCYYGITSDANCKSIVCRCPTA